jgi:hypothetical protein
MGSGRRPGRRTDRFPHVQPDPLQGRRVSRRLQTLGGVSIDDMASGHSSP